MMMTDIFKLFTVLDLVLLSSLLVRVTLMIYCDQSSRIFYRNFIYDDDDLDALTRA
jgi:hypothetical protein